MRHYEKESLIKNFFVFFSLLEFLLILLFFEFYHSKTAEYKQTIFKTMQVCSYTLDCEEFEYDFVPSASYKPNRLYDGESLRAYFPIPNSTKHFLEIIYPAERYEKGVRDIIYVLLLKFIGATLLLSIVAFVFTVYTLKPIRRALKINDEFVKDILHDFNTPIASISLNLDMYERSHDKVEPSISRIRHSVETLVALQNNLKSFLLQSPRQRTLTDVGRLVEERVSLIASTYPKVTFTFTQQGELVYNTHPELLSRIVDNLLSNAAKYNKPGGRVDVRVANKRVIIEDTGIGIRDTKAVLQRYYKEHQRGVGLGLHIVQKLAGELGIRFMLSSIPGKGTKAVLDFSRVIKEKV